MDIKALDKLAKQGMEMPANLKAYEQGYYIASRGLYEQYSKGTITLAQARVEKEQVVSGYQAGEKEWQYFMQLHQVWDKLRQLKETGFDTVLEFEILEELDKIL